MRDNPSTFQEVSRILKENEQLHRRVGYLENQNHRLSQELGRAVLQLDWIATIAQERLQPSRE
jgi:cell division protein FtsB